MILSQEHQMLRDAVREYAREQIAPNAAAWDRDAVFPKDALKGLAAMGLYGVAIPEERASRHGPYRWRGAEEI